MQLSILLTRLRRLLDRFLAMENQFKLQRNLVKQIVDLVSAINEIRLLERN